MGLSIRFILLKNIFTRSLGCAPFAIQSLALSASSFTRSGLSLANIGL